MTIAMMVAGQLARAPDIRTRKNGDQFVTATVRGQTNDGDGVSSRNGKNRTLTNLKP